MKYLLITKDIKFKVFHVLAVAELYQQLEGGTLITDQLYPELYDELLTERTV